MLRKLRHTLLINEASLWIAWLTTGFYYFFHDSLLANLFHPVYLIAILFWLFIVILWISFEVVHHIESLSQSISEPYATLILTLSVVSIEIIVITTIMLGGEDDPTLVRNTMYSIVMIVINGVIGLSLLLGGLRYREQQINLQGSIDFLSVIILFAVIVLVLPNFTQSTAKPTFSHYQTVFIIITSAAIYILFLIFQMRRHRSHFICVYDSGGRNSSFKLHPFYPRKSNLYHTILLIAYLLPNVFLAKQIGKPLAYSLAKFNAPPSLVGLSVAILVLTPEGLSAIRASLANQLQRSMNIAMGSVLATTSFTTPAVLTIGLLMGKTIILGLEYRDITLLLLSLVISILTFVSGRTNILLGAVHLLLFLVYVVLLFD